MKKTLFRGVLLSAVGLLLLGYGTLYLPEQYLSSWGILLFFVSFGCIALGMIPFQRLKSLEMKPNKIELDNQDWCHFFQKGEKIFSLPLSSIQDVKYYQNEYIYGFCLFLKKNLSDEQKVRVYNSHFDMMQFQKRSEKKYGCHLFLPYFSELAYKRFIIQTEQYRAS